MCACKLYVYMPASDRPAAPCPALFTANASNALQAALCCEPLPAAAREELAAGLAGLPQRQLEAALGLVLPRLMAAGDSHLQQHSKAAGVRRR